MTGDNPREARLRQVLDAEGAGAALDEALRSAGRDDVPTDLDDLTTLIGIHLSRALRAWLGDDRARAILSKAVDAVRGDLSEPIAPPSHPSTAPPPAMPSTASTIPPPSATTSAAYDALTSGVIHTRATPVWGLSTTAGERAVWVVASVDEDLCEVVERTAPGNIDVLFPNTTAVLRAALSRNDPTVLVFDAMSPSVPLDKVIAGLTEASVRRVLLWRMPAADRALLIDAVPHAGQWIPVSAEVGPLDLVHLFGA